MRGWNLPLRVLIVAGGRNHRGALAATRALATAGWTVGCASAERVSIASSSRFSRFWHSTPSPERDLDGFLDAIQTAVDEVGYDVILPSSDAETLALSYGRDRLRTCVPYPDHESVVRAFDKLELAIGARRAGLSSPWTILATDEAVAGIDGHVVVKARHHWTPGSLGKQQRWEAEIAPDQGAVTRRVKEIREGGGEPILQEVVPGRIMHCHMALDRQGGLITCVQQLSEPLTYPPGAGTRVRSVTVPVDHDLVQHATSLLNDLDWFGFASLQFIKPDSQDPQLIDFNGRLSLSFEQSIAAGPNFPLLWAAVATGCDYGSVAQPRSGVRYQWLEGDLHRALVERRGGLVNDILDCLRYARGAVHGIWRFRDPRPALSYWRYYARRSWDGFKKRFRGGLQS
jgi:predicted ATP-grasp superfamily ATP-dependent carboligase